MKEPTYSVFVRFRRGQRLSLKRSAPLDVALRFAHEIRSERFHNPDDVFIVDDASGDTVAEASIGTNGSGAVRTLSEPPPTSTIHETMPGQKDELETLLSYVGRWQFRHAQLTFRGGHRLIAAVERSLGQLLRAMEHIQRSQPLDHEVEKIREDTSQALEQVSKVRDGLRQAETKLQSLSEHEIAVVPPVAPPEVSVPSDDAKEQQARKKMRRKG